MALVSAIHAEEALRRATSLTQITWMPPSGSESRRTSSTQSFLCMNRGGSCISSRPLPVVLRVLFASSSNSPLLRKHALAQQRRVS